MAAASRVPLSEQGVEERTRLTWPDVERAFRSLRTWVRARRWRGADPYDGLKSRLLQGSPILRHKWGRIAVIQLCKRSPWDPRRLLRVEPGMNPKGVALFLSGTVRASRVLDSLKLEEDMLRLADLLLTCRSEGWSGAGWGYDFDWQSRVFHLPAYTPTIVVTSYAGHALLDLHELTGEHEYLDHARAAGSFITTELHRTYDSDDRAFCWSYSPLDHSCVYNASLLGSRLLARLYAATEDEGLLEQARTSVEYVVRRQRSEGEWVYGADKSQQWIDNFHTGFNLECLYDYGQWTGDPSYSDALIRGFRFYQEEMFTERGAPKYYSTSLYPVDIHSCAQAIITGAKVAGLGLGGRALAERVLSWTLRNMRHPNGYFYFQKRRFYTHKVPFMRWSQAWMYLALAVFLESGLAYRDARDQPGPDPLDIQTAGEKRGEPKG